MRATPVDAARHSPRIREQVRQWLENHTQYQHIAVYHPLSDEPDLLPLLEDLPGRMWYFPRVADGTMSFHAVGSLTDDLAPGDFGIPEPKPSIPPVDPQSIQAFFCPGLAFERSTGCRLGRGKGYYDRYLAHASSSALRAGVSFPERLVDHTFAEAHDIRMHLVFS